MSDLIDRQKALDAFDYWVKSPMIGYSNGLLRLHEMLEELPSVKQEPCEDCISRELALEKMADYVASGYADSAEDFEEYSKIICQLPPVKPTEKVGHWILLDECSNSGYYCSKCNKKVVKEGWSDTVKSIKYCPNCGSAMKGE